MDIKDVFILLSVQLTKKIYYIIIIKKKFHRDFNLCLYMIIMEVNVSQCYLCVIQVLLSWNCIGHSINSNYLIAKFK